MTVAAFVCPHGTPALIADVVLSMDGVDASHNSSPGSFDFSGPISSLPLMRKIFIVDESMAATAAGEVSAIADFFRWLIDYRKIISDVDTLFDIMKNTFENSSDLQFIVCHVSSDLRFRVSSNRPVVLESDIFGNCLLIGSGSHDVTRKIRNCEKYIQSDQMDGRNFVRGLQSALSGSSIIHEINSNKYDYGGFFEACYFDMSSMKWTFLGDNLHILCQLEHVDHSSFRVNVSKKLIAYLPASIEFGLCCTFEINNDGTFNVAHWLFCDILSRYPDLSPEYFKSLWSKWSPRTFTFTFLIPSATDTTHSSIVSRSTDDDDDHRISASFNESGIEVYWDPELLYSYASEIGSIIRKDFVLAR